MSGIQVSGLLANSAFDWKSIVDQLIAADSIPVTTLTKEQDTNTQKIAALDTLKTSLTDLQDSVQSMRAGDVFSARTVSSNVANTTWKSSSVTGAAVGSYTIAVQQLAVAAKLQGATGISAGLAPSSDVSGVTLATMRTATAVTAGTFTVDGQPVTIALTDSLQDVFDKIAAAAPDVTASYDPMTDKITLARPSGELVLGAANDTSNFLAATKLANSGTGSTGSTAALGTLKLTSTIASAGLLGSISPASGAFALNGVSISYNSATDTLGGLISRINAAGAGVTAAYDAANNRFVLTNKTTGDTGITVTEASGGLLDALGLSTSAGGALAHGKNAQFRINGGPLLTSTSNTLDSSVHGVAGLSVTVNSESTQTLQVESDTATMSSAIQDFITKFNAVQDYVTTNTKITVSGTNVTSALLAGNHEVEDWTRQLQRLAFDKVSGLTGTVTRLNDLGIDFDSISGKLAVKDSGKLATALSDHPEDVHDFFLKAGTGFVGKMYGYLTKVIAADGTQQSNLTKSNSDLADQVTTLQTRLTSERDQLTNAFIAMLDAQSAAKSQSTYLDSYFNNNNNNNSCWVARAVYGARNPRWVLFRHWLLSRAPGWFRALYLRHGERFAAWLGDQPWLRDVIRRWMDARIATLQAGFSSR
jgi:flagellar hook-associated protein 2